MLDQKIMWVALLIFFAWLGDILLAHAEQLYVDSKIGHDANSGTLAEPLQTIEEAMRRVNSASEAGPSLIGIAPGVYVLQRAVVFESNRAYTDGDRLTLEATVLPGDPEWKPNLMPVIRLAHTINMPTETQSFQIRMDHVTIRGLKFLGNPVATNYHVAIDRTGSALDDLIVTQCLFVGDDEEGDLYCPIIGTGNRIVVDHCIFSGCHNSVVFWDGPEGMGGSGNVIRYCIVSDANISGVWTCQTQEDFQFHHNIITGCKYFWMRRPGDQQRYSLRECVVAGCEYYSGCGAAFGPFQETDDEVSFSEENVVRHSRIVLNHDRQSNDYLHVVAGKPGSELGAGLLKQE